MMRPYRFARPQVTRVLAAVLAIGFSSSVGFADTGESYWFRILVPDNLVPAQIGSAVFRQDGDEVLVLAANLPVRQFALRQITGFSAASVSHLPHATVLRIPMPAGQNLVATAGASSLHVRTGTAPASHSIGPSFDKGKIQFQTALAGPVVTLADPQSGRPLLVGTVTGAASLTEHLSGPGYRSVPASRGIAILATSDELALTSGTDGFVLHASRTGTGLPVGYPPVAAPVVAAPFTPGGLNLPHGGLIALRQRLLVDRRRVAEAPRLDRQDAALRLARVMLAMDMAPEARGALQDLVRTDPSVRKNSQWRALLAAADVLAWDPPVAAKDWSRKFGNPAEFELWHGLSDAETDNLVQAATELSHELHRLAALPSMVRAQVLPLAAETLIAGSKTTAAKQLLDLFPHERNLDLARAELKEAKGEKQAALAAYRALFNARDNRVAGIARTRAIMLSYHLHQINAKAAAAALSRHIYDWRGPRHELAVRLDIAKLQAVDGAWPEAMTGLNRARTLFPDCTVTIDAVRRKIFDELVASGALNRMTPLAVTALIQNNTDLVPPGRAGVPVLKILSRQLLALGLAEPAAGILHHLIHRETDSESRARLGLDLARLELRAGSLEAAQAALDTTRSTKLGSALASARAVVASEIAAQEGHPTVSDLLTAATDPNALTAMALRASRQGDWPRAEDAWQKLAALKVPASGPLDQQEAQIVTEWATTAANAKDKSAVQRLRTIYLGRMPQGQQAALFDTITAAPLGSNSSLVQALHQIKAIEALADDSTKTHVSKPK